MKGIFVRIDPDLDEALTAVCRREGYKKGGLISKLLRDFLSRGGQLTTAASASAPPPDPIKEAEKFGIDTTLLHSSLDKTPTERLQLNGEAEEFSEELRRAAEPGRNKMVTQFEHIIKELVALEIQFVLIGGLAGTAHGSAYITRDVDICYERSLENLKRIVLFLQSIEAKLRGAPPDLPFLLDEKTLSMGMNFTFATQLGDLDLLGEVSGIGQYPQAKALSEVMPLYGESVPVLSLDGLIRAKKAAGRPKDIQHLMEYQALQEIKRKRT